MFVLGSFNLCSHSIEQIIINCARVKLSEASVEKISSCYQQVQESAKSPWPIYGINTGFGALAETKIDECDQAQLQKNIILSHAVGVGEPLDFYIAKTMMLLRLNTLIQAYSGASPDLIKMLLALINANCAPYIPEQGSVGASGDLAPLAHMGLLLLGIGKAYIDQKLVTALQALKKAELEPLKLGIRDGLALINGTQAMTASGILAIQESNKLAQWADLAGASSLDALAGHLAPFDPRIHQLKPHPGQILTAHNIIKATTGRTIQEYIKNPLTQDPYSLRCIPQVHGASKDVINHVKEVIERELNSVTDNPLFFFSEDKQLDIISGGNFHGQSLALAMDYLAMALAELANISERRIELLLNPKHSHGLPAFLTKNSGLNSGYMMMHVTASALVSENKILCHPASVDSIPTSANREDHVSMGMNAANKLWRVINNTRVVLAIELLAAHQGLDFRPANCAGHGVQKINQQIRKLVPFREHDTLFIEDLNLITKLLKQQIFD